MEPISGMTKFYNLQVALQAHKQGDNHATEWLAEQMLQHRSRLLEYCARLQVDSHTAEDLVQETILTALNPRQVDALANWGVEADLYLHLCKILRGKISTHFKTSRRREAQLEQLAIAQRHESERSEMDLHAHISMREFRKLFWQAVNACLGETEREILRLRYVEGLAWKEIAHALHISSSALRQRDRHIRKKLRRWKPLAQLCREFGFLVSEVDNTHNGG